GSLALVGIPPFAGFFSKDPIIAASLSRGWYGILLAIVCLIGTFLTGVYAFRLYFIVFTGEPSTFAREHFHPHRGQEGPVSVRSTGAVLAGLSTIGGWLQFSPLWDPLTKWLGPVAAPIAVPTNTEEWVASGTAVALGLLGIGIAWALYAAKRV